MDCRTTLAHRFEQYDMILTKEQSVLTQITSSFEGENKQGANTKKCFGL